MPYQRSQEIEHRLDRVLRLIRTGRYSTPMLAAEVGVSVPTISRCVSRDVDRQKDALLDEISRRLQHKMECSKLFTMRWSVA